LETLPRTTAGKLDRRSLPAPDVAGLDQDRVRVAPRTPAESLLAGIWEEVLKVEHVGIHDSFFELGGESLMALQVITRIRRARGLEVPLRKLFALPTIAELAPLLEEVAAPSAPPAIKVLPRRAR
jgi:acyl carrier protein